MLFFFHVAFDAVIDQKVREKLHTIPTTFAFGDGEMEAIEAGVASIFGDPRGAAHACVRLLGEILAAPSVTRPAIDGNPWRGGGSVAEERERQRVQERRPPRALAIPRGAAPPAWPGAHNTPRAARPTGRDRA